MLKAALSGGYVNFGVFSLYGDDALNNALNMFVKLAYSIPRKDILVRQLVNDTIWFLKLIKLSYVCVCGEGGGGWGSGNAV